MRRTALLVTALVAACNVYEPSLLSGGRGAAGLGAGGGAGREPSEGGTGAASGTTGTGGSSGDAPVSGVGGGGASGGALGEGGMDAEAGAGGEATAGSGGTGGAPSGGKSGAAGKGGAGGAGRGGQGGSGTAGASGAAGSSGTGGSSGTAGAAGGATCADADGCARLSVPLTALDDRTHFRITLGADVDFSNAIVSFRVRKVSATGGRIWAYLQHGGTPDYNLIYGGARNFDQLGSDWTTVTWDVAATVPGFPFDKTVIARLGIEIVASGTGPWTSPTVVDLDGIEVTGASVGPWPFDDASSLSSESSAPDGIFWLSNNVDEVVPGSTLDWLP